MVINQKLKWSLIFDGIVLLVLLGLALILNQTTYLVIAGIYLVVSILNTFRLSMNEERKGIPKIDAEIERLRKESGEG